MQTINTGPNAQQIDEEGFIVGRESAPTSSEAKLPLYPRNHLYPFVKIHENEWELGEVNGRIMVLPMLTDRTEMPGANLINHADKGGSSRADARLVDVGSVKLNTLIGEYRREYPCRSAAKDGKPTIAFYDTWDKIRTWGSGEFLVRRDEAGYNEWRASLLARRIIEPPNELAEDRIRMRLSEKHSRASSRGDANEPRIKGRLQIISKRLKDLPLAFERTRQVYQTGSIPQKLDEESAPRRPSKAAAGSETGKAADSSGGSNG
jgi:hypothetical protein